MKTALSLFKRYNQEQGSKLTSSKISARKKASENSILGDLFRVKIR